MAQTLKLYRCKLHNHTHAYTACQTCGCQYCERVWPACPRTPWHPKHGGDAADIGKRYTELNGVREESDRRYQRWLNVEHMKR